MGHTEPYYPGRRPNIFEDTLSDGAHDLDQLRNNMALYKEPHFETMYEDTDLPKIEAAHIEKNQPLYFFFPNWSSSPRVLFGDFYLKCKFKPPGGGNYAATYNGLGDGNAWLRPNFLNNLIKKVEFIVGGKSITQDHFDHISHITSTMMTPKARTEDDYEFMRSTFDIYRNCTIKANTTRHADHPLTGANLILTPDSLPATDTVINVAQQASIAEQEEWNKRYGRWLLGSKEHTFHMRLADHPMFQRAQILPPSTPFNIRITLNSASNCFQCPTAQVPEIQITEAYFRDHNIQLTSESANKITRDIIAHDNALRFPILRREVSEFNIPKAQTVTIHKALVGIIPTRIFLTWVPVSRWQTHKSTENQYVYEFPGLTNIQVIFGKKEWPFDGGMDFHDVPGHGPPYSDEEIDAMVWANTANYDMIRSVCTPPWAVHTMAANAHDFFRYNFIMAVDLTALGMAPLTQQTREAKYEGDMTIKFTYSYAFNGEYILCLVYEDKNQITWTLPEFNIQQDW